jgi:hypothetical protein
MTRPAYPSENANIGITARYYLDKKGENHGWVRSSVNGDHFRYGNPDTGHSADDTPSLQSIRWMVHFILVPQGNNEEFKGSPISKDGGRQSCSGGRMRG